MEPQVERVRDEAADRSAEVGLQVLVVVPGERRDAVAVDEAELVAQRERELLRAPGEIGVRVGVPALVGQPARDRLVAEQLLAAPQDRRHVQLVVHRQPLHVTLRRRRADGQPPRSEAGRPDASQDWIQSARL